MATIYRQLLQKVLGKGRGTWWGWGTWFIFFFLDFILYLFVFFKAFELEAQENDQGATKQYYNYNDDNPWIAAALWLWLADVFGWRQHSGVGGGWWWGDIELWANEISLRFATVVVPADILLFGEWNTFVTFYMLAGLQLKIGITDWGFVDPCPFVLLGVLGSKTNPVSEAFLHITTKNNLLVLVDHRSKVTTPFFTVLFGIRPR